MSTAMSGPSTLQRLRSLHSLRVQGDKSIVTPEESALICAVIDETDKCLKTLFMADLWERLARPEASAEEKAEILKFRRILCRIPFVTSDAAFLSLAVLGQYTDRNKQTIITPPYVMALWERLIMSDVPWVSQYLATAGEVRGQCSQNLHGVVFRLSWDQSALTVAFAKTAFSPDVQATLCKMASYYNFIM
ncbi:hypothetical protein BDZ89DRAFT_1153451 [Hymenopellis radicata]|nr:hypothetical protein BDZ89DRAFT_1153451 [Hymenopellis radicata]